MSQSIKRFWLVAALFLASGSSSLFAFALLGPFNEPYQVPAIGYDLTTDVGAPKNIGQGYRYNLTNLYYGFDSTFTGYYGSNGVNAIDQAFYIFNSLSNVSSYTPTLSEWPTRSSRINNTASALNLLDLKSMAMTAIIEELGLAEPDRWVYALHDRYTTGATCGNYSYLVDQRNFDPVTLTYSAYVNNTLYGFYIAEYCGLNPNPYAPVLADAIEYTTDLTDAYSAVAAHDLSQGVFFQGLTRDDVGGLRYLYSSTNVYRESAESNSFLLLTNVSAGPQLLITSNLTIFLAQSLTNSGSNLVALYPGLIVNSSQVIGFTNIPTPNYYFYFTFPPYSPIGTFLLNVGTNYTYTTVPLYSNNFANVVIVHSNAFSYETYQTITNGYPPFSPFDSGVLITNTNTYTFVIPTISGDFYILPTNACGSDVILSNVYTNITYTTNVLPVFSNNFFTTNAIISTFSASLITYFTNYYYAYYPVTCDTNTVALRQGVEKINFIKTTVDQTDALLNDDYKIPITNYYYLTEVTNGMAVKQLFRRVILRPDFVFAAADGSSGPASPLISYAYFRSFPNFNVSEVPIANGGVVGGPGTIQPSVSVTFNNVGPLYYNTVSSFLNGTGDYILSDTNLTALFRWGSFDGTTNLPVVYPDATSIDNAVAQLYFQVVTPTVPNLSIAANTVTPYSQQLVAQGGVGPYTWSYDVVPPGLNITTTGILYSSPTNAGSLTVGTYQFNVTATDAEIPVPLTATRQLSITITH